MPRSSHWVTYRIISPPQLSETSLITMSTAGWTMDNGALRLARDHATKGRHYDTVECDVVKAIVRSHAARHVGGIVKPLKKTVIIEIKCLASGMGRNLRWEDHAER